MTSIVDLRRDFFGGAIDEERTAIANALAAGITFADLLEATADILNGGFVGLTGDESVAGTKTFTTAVRGSRIYTDVPSGVVRFGRITISGRGAGSVSDRWTGWASEVSDASGVVGDKEITGAVNNGSGLIRLTVTAHGITDGDGVGVWDVLGTTEANGKWTAIVIDANTIDLAGSTYTNAYTSGGYITNRPMLYALSAVVAPSVARGGLTGDIENGDDVNGVISYNNGTAKATEAFYVGDNPSISGYQWLSQYTANSESEIGFLVGNTGDVDKGFAVGGTIKASGFGLDLYQGKSNVATWGANAEAIRLPNARGIVARNAAASADVDLLKLNASNVLELGEATEYIDTVNGRVALGVTPDVTNCRLQVLAISGSATPVRFEGTDSGSCQVEFHAYAGNPQILGKRAEGTRASKTAVTADQILARMAGLGYHSGAAYGTTSAAIDLMSAEGYTSTAQGGYIKASLKQAGANTLTEAFRIKWAAGQNRRMTMNGAFDFELDTTTGTMLGTASTQKLGFFGATPIVRPSFIAAPSGGITQDAEARTAINSIRTLLINLGLKASS